MVKYPPPGPLLLANWALLAFLANWAPLQAWVSQGLDCQDSRARIQQQAVVGQAVWTQSLCQALVPPLPSNSRAVGLTLGVQASFLAVGLTRVAEGL